MKRSFIIPIFILLISCGKSLSPEAYIKYVEAETYPYRITKKFSDKEFTLIYTPNEYLVLKQMMNGGTINKEQFQKEMESKKDYIHFIFIIKSDKNNETVVTESSNLDDYSNDLMYMMTDVQFDFNLKQKDRSQPCVFANYERNYGLTNKNNIQVVFEKPADFNNIKVVYNDKLFNTGPVVFDFNDIKSKKVNI